MKAPKTVLRNKARLILTLAISAMAAPFSHAQSIWAGTGADENWSTAGNWTGGAPGSSSTVAFNDGAFPLSTNAQGVVNSIVQSSTSISSLTFNNQDVNFQTVQIPFGNTLTISGGLSVGASDTAASNTVVTVTGGGSLIAGTSGTATLSGQNGSGQGSVSILDMSALSNFTFNVGGSSPGSINFGTGGSGSSITVSLGSASNFLVGSTLNVGNNNTRGTTILNLGNVTNNLFADTINLGISKTVGTIQFLNNAGGGVKIANHTGTGRATITLGGESSSGSTSANNNGFITLGGGILNMLASTMTLGYRSNRTGGGTATGSLSFNSGIADITTINMAINSGGDAANGAISISGPGELIIGNGGLSLANEVVAGTGTLTVTNGGTVICSNNIYKSTSIGVGTVTLGGSSLTMASLAGTIGVSNGLPIDNFNITNSTLTLPVQSSAAIAVVNFNPDATTQNTINVSSMPTITGFPAQFQIISYQVAGAGNLNSFVLGTLPGVFQGYISNNTTTLSIDLVVTNGPIAKSDTWTGAINNNWDTTTTNWTSSSLPVSYNDLDSVIFDDTATRTAVTVIGSRAPASMTLNNTQSNYTFSGTGKIIGPVQLVKNDAGSVTLAETGGDSFSGGIMLNGGTLILDNANSSISGGLTISTGTTTQIGNNDSAGAIPAGTLDNEGALIFDRANTISVGTAISGAGTVTQNGAGTVTLTANNGYSGATTINAGTVALTGSGEISSSSGVGVTNGTLDVSGVTTGATMNALTLSNATVNVKVGYLQTNFDVGSLSMSGPSDTINVKSLPPIAVYPFTNALIQSTNVISGNNFVLGPLPAGTPPFSGSIQLSADQTALLLVLTSGPTGIRPSVTWSGTDAAALVSTNWSDAQNWQSPGTPVGTEKVTFNNQGATGGTAFDVVGDGNGGIMNPANINNIVDINSTNGGLTYANAANFHNTLIKPGKTLIVSGSLAVSGSGGNASILGSGGALVMSNLANISTLNVESGTTSTLDMSGLDTFIGNISQIGVGYDIPSSSTSVAGTLYLAKTNIITTGSGFSGISAALVDGGVNNQSGVASGSLYLGLTNALFVDGIVLGPGPATNCLLTFNPNIASQQPSVFIRGISGKSSRVTEWSIGDATVNLNNHPPGSGHVVDFSAGTVNALVSTLVVGQGSQSNTGLPTNQYTGTLNMGAGTLDVTTLRIGVDGAGSAGNGIGILNVSGGTVIADTLDLIGGTLGTAAGTLNLTNGTLVLSNGISIGNATAPSTLSAIDSTVKLLSSTVGTPTVPVQTLNLDGATLQLNADALAPSADIAATSVNASNTTTINLAVITNVTGSAQFPLISYVGNDPYTNLALGTFPAGYTASLVDDTGNSSIDLMVNVSATGPTTNANITHVSLSGTNLVIHGTNNNVPNTSFHFEVLTATNLTIPLSNWTPVATNPFNPDGTFDYTNPVVPGTPRQFIDVEVVP